MDYKKKYLKYKKKYLITKKLIVNKVLDQLQKKNTKSKNKLLGGMDTGTIIGIITAIISVLLGVGWYSMKKPEYEYNHKAEFGYEEKKSEPENLVFEQKNLVFEVFNKDLPQDGNEGETTNLYGEKKEAEVDEEATLAGNRKI